MASVVAQRLDAFLHSPVSLTRGALAVPGAWVVGASERAEQGVRRGMDWCFAAVSLAPTTDAELAATMVILTVAVTLAAYWAVLGKRHMQSRAELRRELAAAEAKMHELQALLDAEDLRSLEAKRTCGKPVRVFVEGAFDLMHYGHANAFRQAKSLGTYLVAGVNSSESIEACKGAPPIMTDDERLAVVSACKWVDEVIPRTPYVMTPEYLDWVIETYAIDYVVHGDDPCLGPDGSDVYGHVKARGMYRSIPRTEGVSTTEIVGRMLMMGKAHHLPEKRARSASGDRKTDRKLRSLTATITATSAKEASDDDTDSTLGQLSPLGIPYRESRFLTTTRMLRLFSQTSHQQGQPSHGPRTIKEGMKVVYISGAFDMFHAGHVSILQKARELGDYLLVGVENDGIANHNRGGSHPIMNLNERVLSVLACKFVDDVILDAPYQITAEMIAALKISVVVTGKVSESTRHGNGGTHICCTDHVNGNNLGAELFGAATEAGIVRVVDSGSSVTVGLILSRICANAERLEAKVHKKMQAEADHYKSKHGLASYCTEGLRRRSASAPVLKSAAAVIK